MSTPHTETTARQVLRILPMTMRLMAAEFRRMQRVLVPAHLSVLFTLSQGACNLSELAEQLAVSLPTMSNTVSKLVAEGLVARTRSEQDRRMIEIEITAMGRDLLQEITSQMIVRVADMLASLSAAELQTVDQGLAALLQAFTNATPLYEKSPPK